MIDIPYNVHSDTADGVARELVECNLLFDHDKTAVARGIDRLVNSKHPTPSTLFLVTRKKKNKSQTEENNRLSGGKNRVSSHARNIHHLPFFSSSLLLSFFLSFFFFFSSMGSSGTGR